LPINTQASRAVKGGTPQRHSISFNTEVWSRPCDSPRAFRPRCA
jgi:hypothetical protein